MIGTNPNQLRGWGVDGPRGERPGVPREMLPPQRIGNAHWTTPDQQSTGTPTAIERRRRLTPVYGTAIPPRGVSGLVRRAAYRVPEYRPRRWLMLMVADRIDVFESTLLPSALKYGAIGALGYFGLRALRARSR